MLDQKFTTCQKCGRKPGDDGEPITTFTLANDNEVLCDRCLPAREMRAMKLETYWQVWYLATDGIWYHVTCELGNISSFFFRDLESAESAALKLAEGKDIVDVEVRETRSVLSFKGAALSTGLGR